MNGRHRWMIAVDCIYKDVVVTFAVFVVVVVAIVVFVVVAVDVVAI